MYMSILLVVSKTIIFITDGYHGVQEVCVRDKAETESFTETQNPSQPEGSLPCESRIWL